MVKKIPLKSGDEYDALTKAKKYFNFKAGQRKKIKARYNKRLRKVNKILLVKCEVTHEYI